MNFANDFIVMTRNHTGKITLSFGVGGPDKARGPEFGWPCHKLISSEHGEYSRISHFQWRKRSVTAAAVWLLALSWRMMGFCTTTIRPRKYTSPTRTVRLYSAVIVAPRKFHELSNAQQFWYPKMSCRMWSTLLWHTLTFAANSCAVHRRSNRESRNLNCVVFHVGSSWMTSLPSWNFLIHRASVRYGNIASPHAWHSPWKHSCLLWHRATLILVQKRCSIL